MLVVHVETGEIRIFCGVARRGLRQTWMYTDLDPNGDLTTGTYTALPSDFKVITDPAEITVTIKAAIAQGTPKKTILNALLLCGYSNDYLLKNPNVFGSPWYQDFNFSDIIFETGLYANIPIGLLLAIHPNNAALFRQIADKAPDIFAELPFDESTGNPTYAGETIAYRFSLPPDLQLLEMLADKCFERFKQLNFKAGPKNSGETLGVKLIKRFINLVQKLAAYAPEAFYAFDFNARYYDARYSMDEDTAVYLLSLTPEGITLLKQLALARPDIFYSFDFNKVYNIKGKSLAQNLLADPIGIELLILMACDSPENFRKIDFGAIWRRDAFEVESTYLIKDLKDKYLKDKVNKTDVGRKLLTYIEYLKNNPQLETPLSFDEICHPLSPYLEAPADAAINATTPLYLLTNAEILHRVAVESHRVIRRPSTRQEVFDLAPEETNDSVQNIFPPATASKEEEGQFPKYELQDIRRSGSQSTNPYRLMSHPEKHNDSVQNICPQAPSSEKVPFPGYELHDIRLSG